jgi:hypothetical protein
MPARLRDVLDEDQYEVARIADRARAQGEFRREFRDVGFVGGGDSGVYEQARSGGFSRRGSNILSQTLDASPRDRVLERIPTEDPFVPDTVVRDVDAPLVSRAAPQYNEGRPGLEMEAFDQSRGRAAAGLLTQTAGAEADQNYNRALNDRRKMREMREADQADGFAVGENKAARVRAELLGRQMAQGGLAMQRQRLDVQRELGLAEMDMQGDVAMQARVAAREAAEAQAAGEVEAARIQYGSRPTGPQVTDLGNGYQVVYLGNSMQVINTETGESSPAQVEEMRSPTGEVIGYGIRGPDGSLTALNRNQLPGQEEGGIASEMERARQNRRREELTRELATIQGGGGVFLTQAARQRRIDALTAELGAIGAPGAAGRGGNAGTGAAGGGSPAPRAAGGGSGVQPIYARGPNGRRVVSRDGGQTFTLAE